MELVKLAERCERADGPDADLNKDMLLALGWRVKNWHPVNPAGELVNRIPDYVGSIDAAMTLLPEGWSFSIGEKRGLPEHIRMFAWLNDHNTPDGIAVRHTEGSARTPALALCAAALRARSLTPIGGK